MNEEKINLVLMDICGRLSHGVITKNCKNNFDVPAHMLPHVNGIKLLIAEYDLKPYLRPMSSMTEEERENFRKVGGVMSYSPQHDTWAISAFAPEAYDWLNKNKFDYRGLIPMGLALEATENMYSI